jgi:hypothetical protein
MLRDTIEKIETRLRDSASLSPERRSELLALLATLKSEVDGLARTHADKAQSIAGFTAASADEATRSDRNPERVQLSLKELSHSIEGFEESHPKLAQAVNSICTTLANLGI